MSATAFQRMRRERIAKMRAEAEAEKPVDDGFSNLTNKELRAMLDEKGVEYDKKANKATLISLVEQAQETNPDDGAGEGGPNVGKVDPEAEQMDLSKASDEKLKALLDEQSIEYDADADKETLIKLLEGAE